MKEVYSQRSVKRWREIFHALVHTKTTGQKRRKAQDQMRLEYRRYTESRVWKSVRDVKLESTAYICEECGDTATQVHHLTYDRCGGKELMEDLQSVCTDCHSMIHGHTKRIVSISKKELIDKINRKKVLDMMNSGDVYWESFHKIYGY